jgi:hypothetical protein
MKMKTSFKEYADYYDLIYKDKNYEREVDFIEEIFDVWNGLAVLRLLLEQRLKEVENGEIRIIRFAVPNLRAFDHVCEVNYKLITQNKKDNTLKEINEKHVMRFYFPQELKYYLENAGFEVLKICPFLDLKGRVDENVWNIAVIARVVRGKE